MENDTEFRPQHSTRNFSFVKTDSRRTYCHFGCLINRNEWKIKEFIGEFNGHTNYRHYCLKCGIQRLDVEMQELALFMTELNRLYILIESNKQNGGGINAGR